MKHLKQLATHIPAASGFLVLTLLVVQVGVLMLRKQPEPTWQEMVQAALKAQQIATPVIMAGTCPLTEDQPAAAQP
jgi:hypothetical protein